MPQRRCPHGKTKSYCKICSPHLWCFKHDIKYSLCGRCGTHPSICPHKRRKVRCTECAREGTRRVASVCEHNRRRYQCAQCLQGAVRVNGERSEMCMCCGMRKRWCRASGGRNLCMGCCSTIVARPGELCAVCNPVQCKRIKRRELQVKQWLQDTDNFTTRVVQQFEYNKSLRCITQKLFKTHLYMELPQTCLRYIPDFYWSTDTQHVILEVDEHQHKPRFGSQLYRSDSLRETQMMKYLSDLTHRSRAVTIVRFNPDAFATGFKSSGKFLPGFTSRECRKSLLCATLDSVLSCSDPLPFKFRRVMLFFDCRCENMQRCNFIHEEVFNSVDELCDLRGGP